MRSIVTRSAVIISTAALVIGCSTRPDSKIDAAHAAIARARSADAEKMARDSMQSAERAQAALHAELEAQDQKWFKSYDKARDLADQARVAADRATAEAQVTTAGEQWAAKARADRARRARTRRTADYRAASGTAPVKVRDVRPIYPAIARSARVDGTVVIEATIDPEGRVAETRVVRSVPLLDQAALEAVRQWEYRPSMKDGRAVPSVVTVNVNFVRS